MLTFQMCFHSPWHNLCVQPISHSVLAILLRCCADCITGSFAPADAALTGKSDAKDNYASFPLIFFIAPLRLPSIEL
jgi:hypothetical protein